MQYHKAFAKKVELSPQLQTYIEQCIFRDQENSVLDAKLAAEERDMLNAIAADEEDEIV